MYEIPQKFNIGNLEIHYYGIFVAIGLLVAVLLCFFMLPVKDLKKDLVFDFVLWGVPFGIVGARLFYVLFSGYNFTFLEALKIWEGGLSIIGAILFGAFGVFIACKIKKQSFLKVADACLPAVILGQGIGRIGCLFGGCCRGIEVSQNSLKWFPMAIFENGKWLYSTFLYECLWDILGFMVLVALLLAINRKDKNSKNGIVASIYLMWYGLGRFLIEFIRGDPLIIFEKVKFSQMIALVEMLVGLALFIVLIIKFKKERKNV